MNPITQSPTPRGKEPVVVNNNPMNFGEALYETARGRKITKIEWENKETYGHLVNAELRLHKDGKDHMWKISEGDIIGKDWVII